MDIGVISVRYARALLKSATASGDDGRVYEEMQTLVRSFIEVPELRHTIANPMLSRDKKEELLLTACGSPCDLTKRFVALVLSEGRADFLQFMAASYVTLYRKQKNLIRGKLTTAVPVSAETERNMKQMVERKTKGEVDFQTEVNPDIIGGFILEYDTYRMDASVRAKLNTILSTLKK